MNNRRTETLKFRALGTGAACLFALAACSEAATVPPGTVIGTPQVPGVVVPGALPAAGEPSTAVPGAGGVTQDPTAPGGETPGNAPTISGGAVQAPQPGVPVAPITPGPVPPAAPVAIQDCGTNGMIEANVPRRLNRIELNNLAIDVFGSTIDAFLNHLPNDQNSKVAGSSLTVTGSFSELYDNAATEVAAEYVTRTDPAASCNGAPSAACAVTLLRPIAARMTRRPMTPALEAALGEVTQIALAGGLEFNEAIQESIHALFRFPDTLYMDTYVSPAPGVFQLDSYSLAERLALAVWSSVPDAQLLAAAATGSLETPAGLQAEIARMLADPTKGHRFVQGFADGFLTTDAVGATIADVPEGLGPDQWAQLVNDMVSESTLFLADAFASNAPVSTFATAKHTFLNANLAEHYGLSTEFAAAGGNGGEFVKVALPVDSPRVGLTTHGFFMARLSHHPMIFRGKEFRLQFMCGTLPGAPDDPAVQAAIDLQLQQQADKTEEELAFERETTPGCAGCHALMDPLGKAYGAFDETGRIREGVDTASNYLGTPLTDAVSAANYIATSDGFAPCIVGHVLAPVANRSVETAKNPVDRCIADSVAAGVGADPGFRDLLVASLNSAIFTTRVVGQ